MVTVTASPVSKIIRSWVTGIQQKIQRECSYVVHKDVLSSLECKYIDRQLDHKLRRFHTRRSASTEHHSDRLDSLHIAPHAVQLLCLGPTYFVSHGHPRSLAMTIFDKYCVLSYYSFICLFCIVYEIYTSQIGLVQFCLHNLYFMLLVRSCRLSKL